MNSVEKEQAPTTEDRSVIPSSKSPLKSAAWSKKEEDQLVRQLDWHILPVVTILYLANFIDRTNIGNAKVAGLEHDIGLVGYQCSASTLSGAFGGLLASGLLNLPKLKGVPSGAWRNIFLIEGAITIALGLAGFYLLPQSAEKSRFLEEREKMIAVQRLVQDEDNGNTAGARAVQGDSRWRAFTDLNTWICGICFLFDNLVVQGISLFMPTLMKNMGYSTIQSQLRTVPPYPNTVRAVSSALVVAIGTIGPIITSWIYLPGDSPRYHIANSVQLAGQVTFFILVLVLVIHNTLENRRRAKGERDYRLNASEEEVARLGSLHPNFRLII
ncbi:unnamed protein product [Rhizoctonia solani]|uniref:Uncharacterized protein n=1 Tax=Rhizoctonia solani TaxID=456999 RepID=A0A8H3DK81_9AGAM|nr:unnamed protein product [Rhizoctonia solani]